MRPFPNTFYCRLALCSSSALHLCVLLTGTDTLAKMMLTRRARWVSPSQTEYGHNIHHSGFTRPCQRPCSGRARPEDVAQVFAFGPPSQRCPRASGMPIGWIVAKSNSSDAEILASAGRREPCRRSFRAHNDTGYTALPTRLPAQWIHLLRSMRVEAKASKKGSAKGTAKAAPKKAAKAASAGIEWYGECWARRGAPQGVEPAAPGV